MFIQFKELKFDKVNMILDLMEETLSNYEAKKYLFRRNDLAMTVLNFACMLLKEKDDLEKNYAITYDLRSYLDVLKRIRKYLKFGEQYLKFEEKSV